MKPLLLTLALTLVGAISQAETTYHVSGREVTKTEALKALLKDSQAQVTKCQDVELTDKATLKARKDIKE